ncbi:amino acid adenylation domain-containing protein, partial [Pseudomonas gingeri]
MQFSELMAVISTHAIRLQREEDDLVVLGNDDALDDTLWQQLSAHKAQLLDLVARHGGDWLSPALRITPDMLPLVTLEQEAIDRIVAGIPGGAANVQDIYPLAPLQAGMLYHHLAAGQGDPYLLHKSFVFDDRERLGAFVQALQWVIERHDILRTSIVWERLDEPLQVVWRQAPLVCEEVAVDAVGGEALEQLRAHLDAGDYRLDLRQAPLLRLVFAHDEARQQVVAVLLFHHMALDYTGLEVVRREIRAHLLGQATEVGAAVPFRDYLARARLRLDESAHEAFFREMLGDIDEPTLPFGLQDVQGDGRGIEESRIGLPPDLSRRLRQQARQAGVSVASVLHLAMAQVLGKVCGRSAVVFGTVLLGRMDAGVGAEQALGMFINTLPLRVDVGSESVLAGLLKTHERLTALLGHEQASLALAQRCSGVSAPTPLFSAMLNYRHSDAAERVEVSELAPGIRILGGEDRTNYPLTVSVDDLGEDFTLAVKTLPAIGAQRVSGYLQTALEALVDALEHDPVQALQGLSILPVEERQHLLVDLNATEDAYDLEQPIQALFEAQVRRTPEAVAVVAGERSLTYRQLNEQANQLAHYLREQGVQPDSRVAICVERGLELVIGLWAIVKAGGAYVPLDPGYPLERLGYMLQDSASVLVLVHGATRDLLGPVAVPLLDFDRADWHDRPLADTPVPGLGASNLAYVIYTSGSTGTPKGVTLEHRGLCNLVHWSSTLFTGDRHGALLQKAPFSFDGSVWEFFWPLTVGMRLVLARPEGHRDPAYLAQLVREQQISVIKFVPAMLQQFLELEEVSQCISLTDVFCGGGELTAALARSVQKRLPRVRLHNVYGPTEATVDSTAWTLEPGAPVPEPQLPIGRPISNTRLYVLDDQDLPVPQGVSGQLHIGGVGVARGYLGLPQLVAERFIDSPFVAGDRLYRTGDLVRYRADGNLEFLGRNDDQVKIRGLRIELGEVQSRLSAHPALKDAVVMVREDEPGDPRLVAYYAAEERQAIESLRAHLLEHLPGYMLPTAFVHLQALPLTPNGKPDRKALPAPDPSSRVQRVYEAPRGEVEITLARIWAEVLKVEQVGRHDNFFELGGHSLLAVKLIERMRQVELSADVRVLFGQPTLAALAAGVGGQREVAVPANRIGAHCRRITPDLLPLVNLDQAAIDRIVASVPGGVANVQDIYPLAPLQGGILYHHLTTEGDPYVLQAQLGFAGEAQVQAFASALQGVIDRHDVLRTSVHWEHLDEPVQVVWRQASLGVQQVEVDPRDGDILEQLHRRFDPRHYRLDLGQAPLMRLAYAQDPAHDRWVGVLLRHHLVLDHTSLDVLLEEMRASLAGETAPQTEAVPYRNYVAQARLGLNEQAHEAFFREMLADIDEPTLPFGLQDVQGDGRGIGEASLALDPVLSRRLREQARQQGVSAASLMHLGWAQVLGQLARRRDVVFGTVLLGRLQGGEGADRALGMFINTLPLRVDAGQVGVRDGLKATHARLSQLLSHEHASLALAQRCSGVDAASPLFSALLNYRHSAPEEAVAGQLQISPGIQVLRSEERSNYPLVLSVDDRGRDFSLKVLAVESIGAQRICGYMNTLLEQLVQALEQAPGSALEQLSILPDGERRQLLEGFNANRVDYPRGQTVQGLFEAQVARSPEAVAVVQGGEQLNYRLLNLRANRLAHHLRKLGVQPDDRVAICMRRSPQMLVGLLAILKAGAGYVPLDPALPAERLGYLIDDSAPVALLTQGELLAQLPRVNVPVVDLDRCTWQDESSANPHVTALGPANLAYVIYTSGSTGLPKGVMVEHRTLENLVHWHCDAFELEQGRHTSSVAGVGFDAMAWEVWPALCVGATLHLPSALVGNQDIDALLDWWCAQPLAVSFLPTPVAEYAFSRQRQHPTLRTLLIGGDRLRQFGKAPGFAVVNNYGPTEATVVATSGAVEAGQALHIGKPLANGRVYLLDEQQRPVPVGVAGELYVGGAGVARGYLNRPELTAERFLDDPFSREAGARMYRTGDLARWLADGTLDYLGRNDDQVKIRGMRIEPGEIETALMSHDRVKDAVVLVRDGRLVAWFTEHHFEHKPVDIQALRRYLQERLPEYMVPAAYVRLEALPLTANGKLDRRTLPAPEPDALLSREFEAPQGEIEITLARIWAELLKLGQVGRHDHFFELGGHSLLAVSLVERMRQAGLSSDVRTLFSQPTLAALAASVGSGREVEVPPNGIPADCQRITPSMLPLVALDQAAIDRIVASVPGGAANVQDIYPLAPLQEGILYHHLSAGQGDPYLLQTRLVFDGYERLQGFVAALQQVIDRHDILRTGVLWEGLEAPLQVVRRVAELPVQEVVLDTANGDVLEQLCGRFDTRQYRLDITRAPLIHLVHAWDATRQRVVAILLFHHLALDHTAIDVVVREMRAWVLDPSQPQPASVPYRNYVAQARLGLGEEEHEAFFRAMLGDISEPTLPFGLQDVRGDGRGIEEARLPLAGELSRRVREQARQLGVSAASLVHLAWAQVLGQVSQRDDVVFGTVLMGRLQGGEGADRALGVFINTLPLRVEVGRLSARAGVKATHARLSALLGHEHASLALAQRCSAVEPATPLFSALLNYRHSSPAAGAQQGSPLWPGIEQLGGGERSNYPLTLSVDDLGDDFRLTVLALHAIGAQRMCRYMETALEQLVQALEQTPEVALDGLSILPAAERQQLLAGFNASAADYPRGHTLHELFEARAQAQPEALAVVQAGQPLSYGELNRRANRLAHHLLTLGVQPDDRVALSVLRGPDMLVGLLAILKSGAAYVPLDPSLPTERLAYLLDDSAPRALLTQENLQARLPALDAPLILLDRPTWQAASPANPQVPALSPAHLAYVIYTSGSTGLPKGVMVEHRSVENLVHWHCTAFDLQPGKHTASVAGFGFDAMAWEVWPALCGGATLHLPPGDLHNEQIDALLDWWRAQPLDVGFLPTPVAEHAFSQGLGHPTLRTLLIGGDRLRQFGKAPGFVVINNYGPTEATVVATSGRMEVGAPLHIGTPMGNARVYLLDRHQQPVPVGVEGELYVGGAGVARGYLNRADLTAERFLDDPFSPETGARMYRTGDLARWLADGTVDYLGRNDDQVKIRGLRIEPGEIESALATHECLRDVVVLVRDGRLVAYFTEHESADIQALRDDLQGRLPDYMVPSAYVRLEALPLTANGKLDRKALPAPDQGALFSREYQAPQGEVETTLARIWAELLKVEQVGRHDHFFELGGHSLLAVRLIERMRQAGLSADVRVLFNQPTLAALAAAIGSGREVEVPDNRVAPGCQRITPEMLSLIDLDQASIDRIVARVPGGAANIQEIYPLAPLQEGMLYHHLSAQQGDPYLLQSQMIFASVERLQAFAGALQQVIDRHDILRTGLAWEGLDRSVQVVLRQAALVVQEVALDPAEGDILAQLQARFDARHHRMDIGQAPLVRLVHATDTQHPRIVALLLFHHIVLDHTALQAVREEMQASLLGFDAPLTTPVPYRNYVAQACLGVSEQEHEAFFGEMLGDIVEPTLPFGLQDVQGDGQAMEEVRHRLPLALSGRLRHQARALGVSAASLFHLAWARLLAVASGKDSVVFGTVLLGRLQGGEGADRALGVFINTLPLRVDVDDSDVRAGVMATHARLTALLGHEHASLALAQRCSGVAAPLPLFSAMLNYRHGDGASSRQDMAQAWQGIETLAHEGRTNYPLTLSVNDLGEGFNLTALTLAQVGAQRLCDSMQTVLESLADALEQAPECALNRLPVLTAAQREQLLVGCNSPEVNHEQAHTLHQLFEGRAQRTPQAVAVIDGERQLTYGELNRRANRLARHLRKQGVRADARVAICVERGLSMIVGLLAILKAGGAYVPLDPTSPMERLAYQVQDSQPVVVLVQGATRELLGALAVPVLDLDRESWQDESDEDLVLPELTPRHLAYVIYTSGSTGLPKGVMIEHRQVVRLFAATRHWFDFNEQDVWALFHSFAFDFSVWEIWGALVHGAHLLIVPQGVSRSPDDFHALLCTAGVTILNQTPSAFRQLIVAQGQSPLKHSLRQVIFGGEALDPTILKPWYARVANAGTQLVNMYGITETTVHVTYHALMAADAQLSGVSPIGRRIPDLQLYLLDERREPVPVNVVGELYVGGAGVARGYLNRPELTAERFIADPFSGRAEARLYKTGDLGRWLADGSLEYLGRNDDQVKIRGFRIELGEIEARLAACDGVREAVVIAREDEPGDQRLVAYIIAHDGRKPLAADLRGQLLLTLADYMVPSAFVLLERFPLTTNGKLDRKALPAPDQAALSSRAFVAPQGEVELALARIWAEVLKVERVGRHDNFFELGGHSLLAVKLIERMRQAGLSADVRALFSQPTLAALAQVLGRGRTVRIPANLIPGDCQRLTPELLSLIELDQATLDQIVARIPGGAANVQDIYPLAPLQEGILYHHLSAEQGDPYLLQSRMAFASPERLSAFVEALQKVIERHDILRTAVHWQGLDSPVQVVLRHAELQVEQVACDPAAGDVLEQLHARFDARHWRMDLTQAPLIRLVHAFDAAQQRTVAILLFHHLALDHAALEVVRHEMQAGLLGRAEPAGAVIPYRNYVAQARLGVSEQEHEAFFRDMLGDIDEPTLPFGLQDVRGDGNAIEEVVQTLPATLSERLRAQARVLGVSAASLFHLAWAQVLAATSGKEAVVFGTVLLGRMQGSEGLDRALGMFINTLPLRVDIDGTPVAAGVRVIHGRLTTLLGHEHASLALAQRCSGVAAPLPLFSAMLNYRHSSVLQRQPEAVQAWQGIDTLASEERTNYPLALNIDDLGDGFILTAMTVARIGAQRICDYLRTALASLVEALEQAPERALNRLPVLTAQEREHVLFDLNATQVNYSLDQTLHGMFEARVERTPDAVAVVAGEHRLSCRELNRQANQLAHHLRGLGVGPDARVAICVERGLDMVIGLLAILKAGGAYVPLDPAYPSERIAYMLQDSVPVAVLVQGATRELLGDVAVPVIDLDVNTWQDLSVTNPDQSELSARHLAYVIYTSGSTGQPKGVMNEHGAVVNRLLWMQDEYGLTVQDAVLQKTPFSFDVSVWEFFWPLFTGARLVM